jgi:phosphonate degradation associated HDIG domain protein
VTSSAPDPTASTVAEVVDLFGDYAHHRYDEVVSQMDHALQTAALARADGAPDVLVVAALLHDVGHLLELRDGGIVEGDVSQDLHHEVRGAAWLSAVFPPEVTRPIALHVEAKRYLCALDPSYRADLSAGSRASLARQGGPMNRAEMESFQANSSHFDAVRLRRWDDAGKVTDLEVPPFEDHLPALVRVTGRKLGK